MKIAILTYQRSISYGAFAQCLALAEVVKRSGAEVEVIDYMPQHRQDKLRLIPSGRIIPPRSFLKKWRLRRRFAKQIESLLPLTSQTYTSYESLKSLKDDYDAVICGSDQIWNPSNNAGVFDQAYFAAFAGSKTIKIAYAASFGSGGVNPEDEDQLRGLLSELDCISVRETSGVELAQRLSDPTCVRVCDPTILLADFDKFLPPSPSSRRGIVSFCLQYTSSFHETLELVQRNTQEEIYDIDGTGRVLVGASSVIKPSLFEWMDCIRRASFVVTNSFHGVVFCLLFKTPFVFVNLSGDMGKRNERIYSLLECVHLRGVICSGGEDIAEAYATAESIDWKEVESILKEEQSKSLDFLSASLGGEL